MSSNQKFESGVKTAKTIGCSDPFAQALSKAVGDAISNNRSDGQGGDSRFVRTCALEFDRERCSCLASKAQAVIPDVYKRRYTPQIIRRAIKGNFMQGFSIFAQCGISSY